MSCAMMGRLPYVVEEGRSFLLIERPINKIAINAMHRTPLIRAGATKRLVMAMASSHDSFLLIDRPIKVQASGRTFNRCG
ncbi:hypothetical protein [Onishia niordana]|uniref:hypothetical protein n=1 Tax=Onishia niordana TaxID=2508711 RepID=UPI0010A09CD6|nr:hypothetical protein [Halomonas niordiana]